MTAGAMAAPIGDSIAGAMTESCAEPEWPAAADLAVASMRTHGIEPTAENYAVWYAYHRNADVDLVRTVDILVSNNQSFDDRRMAELRERFGGQAVFIAEATSLIREALGHVVSALGDMGAENDAFARHLDRAAGQIAGDGHPKDHLKRLRAVVDALASQTRTMAEENRKLGHELSTTSARMNQLQQDLEGVQKEALTDALTGLDNRRAFEDDLRRTVIDAMETGSPLCLLMIDIDHFKHLNDTHGHQTGDEVLRLVGRVLRECIRDDDRPSRYGGEEFAILLPQTTLGQAAIVAERVRARTAKRTIVRRTTGETVGTITLSLGMAEYIPGESMPSLVQRADCALYRAKGEGRNRIAAAD